MGPDRRGEMPLQCPFDVNFQDSSPKSTDLQKRLADEIVRLKVVVHERALVTCQLVLKTI